ncbi:threonine aldolase family protein [Endozoicomonas ascidiicola]|uniref:threonine aldolase family protein n=1 Tax=Endozoicomonas ascidiicola TaxID=1698521 RepID=UPI00082FC542|nr:beta-eliminating lyase-related protein [Endozoicomonas ascidiicola]
MARSLTSDNASGVSPEVMEALVAANDGHAGSYGGDQLTREATEMVVAALGKAADLFFVYNGTGANTLCAKALLRSIDSIICADTSHMITNEVGAPVNATGSRMITVPSTHGKITPEQIRKAFHDESWWGPHATRPRMVSISQSTEFGTVYTLEEMADIKSTCEALGLILHVDGCRLYNVAVALDCSLSDICQYIDVLSLGGTKNGLMFGEAVVFFDQTLSDGFGHIRKQGLQLHSKMRFISAQFKALFTDDLWKRNAMQANRTMKLLADGLQPLPGIELMYPVETNQAFFTIPEDMADQLMAICAFNPAGPEKGTYRMVTSFDTTEEDVLTFIEAAKRLV